MIILLGASGYIGGAFRQYFEKLGVPCQSVSRREVNYTDVDALVQLIKEVRPNFLICAAGYSGKPNVDACEIYKADCLNGNAVLPGVIREACERTKTPWGHVSSGCIFTGDKGEEEMLKSEKAKNLKGADGAGREAMDYGRSVIGMRRGFTEEDQPNFTFRQNNCSFYSGTKALGEEVLGFGPEFYASIKSPCANSPSPIASPLDGYVWRLRIPFNHEATPRNYLTKLMRYQSLLEATNSISQLQEFVQACWECFNKRIPFGLYHVTNPGYVTTHEVVELIKKSGVCNKEYTFFQDESDFMKRAAKAPRSNCILDGTKLVRHGIQLTEVHEALECSLKQWKAM